MNRIPEYPRTSFTYPSWPSLVPDEGPWSARCLKHTINYVVIKWDLGWELAEERFSSSSSPWNIITGHYISVSSSWLELFPSQKRTGTALSASSGLQHSSAPSLLFLVAKVTCEWVHVCGGAGWLLEESAVPVWFVEKSALGCTNEWSGCIAKGKSLSVLTSCRDR